MKKSNNPAKYEVLIKQCLRSILDISVYSKRLLCFWIICKTKKGNLHFKLVTEPNRHANRQKDRQTGKQSDRQRETDKQTDSQTQRQTNRQTQTDRFIERHTESVLLSSTCNISLGYHQGPPVVWHGCCSSADWLHNSPYVAVCWSIDK